MEWSTDQPIFTGWIFLTVSNGELIFIYSIYLFLFLFIFFFGGGGGGSSISFVFVSFYIVFL